MSMKVGDTDRWDCFDFELLFSTIFLFSGMNQVQRRLNKVDCILEVHDARVSFGFPLQTEQALYGTNDFFRLLKLRSVE